MRLNRLFFILFVIVLFLISSCTKSPEQDLEFKKMCHDSGYEWMLMKPTEGGKIIKDAEECFGCMVGLEHICNMEKFRNFVP